MKHYIFVQSITDLGNLFKTPRTGERSSVGNNQTFGTSLFDTPTPSRHSLFDNRNTTGTRLFGNNSPNVNFAAGKGGFGTNTDISQISKTKTTESSFSFENTGSTIPGPLTRTNRYIKKPTKPRRLATTASSTHTNTGSFVNEIKTSNIFDFSFGNTSSTSPNTNTGSIGKDINTSNISSFSFGNTGTNTTTNTTTGSPVNDIKGFNFGYELSLDATIKNTGNTNNNTSLFGNKNKTNPETLSSSNNLKPAVTSMLGNTTSRGEVNI